MTHLTQKSINTGISIKYTLIDHAKSYNVFELGIEKLLANTEFFSSKETVL